MFTQLNLFGFLWGAWSHMPGKGFGGQCLLIEIIGHDQRGVKRGEPDHSFTLRMRKRRLHRE